MKHYLTMLAGSAALTFLVSCAAQNDLTAMAAGGYLFRPDRIKIDPNAAVSYGWWRKPAGLTGQHHIVVDTQLQQATYYIGDQMVGRSRISSGKAGHVTPRGTFKILDKDATHKSSSYGSIVDSSGNTLVADYKMGNPIPAGGRYKGAAMNNALKVTNTGIWLHEGLVTGAPESHGCIRLPADMAKIFFDNTEVGTPITIL